MSQPIHVMAFRARMKQRGYLDIHIYKTLDGWFVSGIDPVFGYGLSSEFSDLALHYLLKP